MIDEEINLDIINIETNVSSGPNVESSITTGMNITDVGIGGPRGEKGDKGDTGSQGAKGDTGATGPQGPQGIQGEKGEKGDKGDKGEKGDTGATGPQGPQGEKGTKGDQGIQGPKGDTGPQGPQGEKGDTGAKGDKGDKGDTGPQGPQGEKGDTGDVSDVKIAGTSVVNAGVANIDYGSFATAGVIKASSTYGTQFASTGAMYAQTKTYEQYTDSTSPGLFIGKGTLENVIEGKGLVSNTDYATNAVGGVVKTNTNYGTNVDSNGSLRGTTKTYADYGSMHDLGLISKVTLENVITGKGLVSNTDFASNSIGGVIRVNVPYATKVNSSGILYASNLDYETYGSTSDNAFIGKGTLENVITGKGLVDQTALAGKQDTLTAGTGIDITNNVISATGGGGTGNNVFYGTCATGATTAAKVIVCEDFTASDLVAGTRLTVLFTNGNSFNGTSTLNVNNTGAKNIYYNGTTTNSRYMWVAGESVEFVYNGAQWATVNGGLATTTYYGVTKLLTSAASDSQSVAITPRSMYYLANYSIAPFYSSSSTYAVGDKVRYTYYLYECITAIDTPEAWTAAHWQQIDTLQEQIDALEGSIPTVNNATITVTNNGKTVGTFTTNASSAVTIALKTQHTSWGAYHEL